MASELKPCPLCGADPSSKFTDIKAAIWCEPCGLHMEYSTAMVSLRIAEEHQRSILTKRWNTRPAPAATDTGLETVRYEIIETRPSGTVIWQCVEHENHANEISGRTQYPSVVNALCRRSQAAELLAAERAESVRLSGIASEQMARAEKAEAELAAERAMRKTAEQRLAQSQDDLKQARTDNAAQAARIKAETELREDHQQRNKELEAKLAAAEKALEPFADIADLIDAETEGMAETDELILLFHDYEFAKWPVSLFRQARAVLGGKPS